MSGPGTARLLVVIVLAAAGIGISFHLTAIHTSHVCYGIPGSCMFSESHRCDLVNTSRWSELFGVPVAHLGMLTYVFLAVAAAGAAVRLTFRPRAHAYLFLTALWGVLFSCYMATISLFVIKAVCDWCVSLYAINALLLAVLWRGGFRASYDIADHLSADWKLMRRPSGLLLVGACVAAFAGSTAYLWLHLKGCRLNPPQPRVHMDTAGLPALGPEGAKVTIAEISDFECPFCRKASRTLASVLDGYRGRVRLVFRHYPLDQGCNKGIKRPFHRNACDAAKAAVCARQFFWPYAKRLFEGDIDRAALLAHARHFGLDERAFEECIGSREAAEAVARDIRACDEVGIDSVPVFLINGRKLVGAQTPEKFRAIIEEELAAAR